MVSVDLDLENRKILQRSLNKAKDISLKLKPAFLNIVNILRVDTFKNFSFEQPNYVPLEEVYLNKKITKYGLKPILVASGRLKKETLIKGKQNHIERITNKSVVFGTKNEYAIYLQKGTRKMKARPFLFLTKKMADKYNKTIFKYIDFEYRKLGLKK